MGEETRLCEKCGKPMAQKLLADPRALGDALGEALVVQNPLDAFEWFWCCDSCAIQQPVLTTREKVQIERERRLEKAAERRGGRRVWLTVIGVGLLLGSLWFGQGLQATGWSDVRSDLLFLAYILVGLVVFIGLERWWGV